ncbi:apolipoprotein N-acyltransferase [Thalassotalea psychrophila]|uniref:Apolipoprotein N-acyltransferase n=1 Tax=Thalassotalea psychrophila TaxID=3065647 RepID=A0ABY9TQT3_9GAMM|nr:apolipoprotein N-acyltransferase [Colwelliaceae bacterium SQ149]
MTELNGRTFNILTIKNPTLALLFSFISGCSLVFAFAPFSFWPITFAAIVFWLAQLSNKSSKQAFKQGLSFGFGYFAAGISWVHVSIEKFGGMPLIASLLLMLLLCAYLALYPALAAWLSAKLSKDKQVNLYYLPFVWLFSEYLRSVMLTGFPWLSLGYSQIDSPFSSLAPVVGEVGITFFIILFCVAIAQIINQHHQRMNSAIIVVTMMLITSISLLNFVEKTGKTTNVALVQGNIKQELRWDKKAEENIIHSYIESSKPLYKNNDLVIWPEAAIPRIEPLAQDYLTEINIQVAEQQSSLITGLINYDIDSRIFFNRLVVLGKKQQDNLNGTYYYGNSNHYNKHHLLPIGEFVPFADFLRPIAPFFNLPMSSFSRGDYVQPNLVANGINLAPLICFEIAFPQQLAANIRSHTDMILTVSNDAWFGASHGPDQHLEIARMRALEFGKPMLRATNNGLTAVIDHKGKIIAEIPQFTESVLQTTVELVNGDTPYSIWGRYFDKFLMLLFIMYLMREKLIR